MRTGASLGVVAGALAVLTAVGCGGCSPTYVLRSAYEESRILWRREPIATVLAQPDLTADTRSKLETALAARKFAADQLGLKVGGAYGTYAEAPPGALLHVVSAAKQTELVPYTWWFPIVGDVAYRGYFSLPDAEEEAKRLDGLGYDTYVRSSIAFSTLGWFDDPVLSSWMAMGRVGVAETVIHELLHRTIYLSGQTAFNESFANFVGERGAIAFFAATDGAESETARAAKNGWKAEIAASDRLMTAIAKLNDLYADAREKGTPLAQVLEERRPVFAAIGDPEKLNNAVIVAQAAYLDRLSWFEEAAGEKDLRSAIAEIGDAARAKPSDPWDALRELAPQSAARSDEAEAARVRARRAHDAR